MGSAAHAGPASFEVQPEQIEWRFMGGAPTRPPPRTPMTGQSAQARTVCNAHNLRYVNQVSRDRHFFWKSSRLQMPQLPGFRQVPPSAARIRTAVALRADRLSTVDVGEEPQPCTV